VWASPGELQISVDKARLVLRLTNIKEECSSDLSKSRQSSAFRHRGRNKRDALSK
jgi:hypothetical protein